MNKSNKFSAEVRERAVRMVQEHRGEYPSQWAAIESIAPKIGCTSQTLLGWVKRDEVDSGEREGVSTSERERLKALEREVKELRRANEILKLASASCGLPRRATGVMLHSFAIRRAAAPVRYGMNVCGPRSSVSGTPTCGSTERIKSGSR
jgi:transposase